MIIPQDSLLKTNSESTISVMFCSLIVVQAPFRSIPDNCCLQLLYGYRHHNCLNVASVLLNVGYVVDSPNNEKYGPSLVEVLNSAPPCVLGEI